jgi:hypothetical protein
LNQLESIQVPEDHKTALREFAEQLLVREHWSVWSRQSLARGHPEHIRGWCSTKKPHEIPRGFLMK